MNLDRIRHYASVLYGEPEVPAFLSQLEVSLRGFEVPAERLPARDLAASDALLITYPDMVREPGRRPLSSLKEFAERYLDSVVSGIHILPFFPSSSDDGFSVMDYREVDAGYGDWSDISDLGRRFELMFDAVVNHASAQGAWFQGFLRNEDPYNRYFLTVDGNPDLSGVVRPRTLPLLTEFQTIKGTRQVWTTFSPDQVDLDYHNPAVLLAVIEILLYYVQKGARYLRLDAIAYIWKELGTSCIHRPQVHAIVQLIREVLGIAAPNVRIITETNVPHTENISYLGDGTNEAHLIYNFTLPPLLLHTFRSGSATAFTDWAEGITWPAAGSAFLNVLATHDGIGLNGIRGIIDEAEIEKLAEAMAGAGGKVSRKSNADGSSSPYEINANYFDALAALVDAESEALQIRRFLTAHAIMLGLKGVPAIYFHSMFGSRGWSAGPELTGAARSINRQKLDLHELGGELADGRSQRSQVYKGMVRLMRARRGSEAFAPDSTQRMARINNGILAFWRSSSAGEEVLCAHNITREPRVLAAGSAMKPGRLENLLGSDLTPLGAGETMQLEPYESVWLRIRP